MKSRAKRTLGYAFAAAALAWVFHDVHPWQIAGEMRHAGWVWIAAAVAADVLSYTCEGVRWRLLLRPVGDLPVMRAVQAIYAGLFTNEIVPLRFGEVVRAYLASRWIGRPVVSLVPSMLVGRLIDGVWLVLGGAVVLFVVPLPVQIARAGAIFGAFTALLVVTFVVLAIRPPMRARKWAAHPEWRVRSAVGHTLLGFGDIGIGRGLGLAALFSAGLLLMQIAAFWFAMAACHLPVPLAAGAVVFVIIRLGTAIPNAPANVGSFQFFTVLGLQLFGVAKPAAAAFSVIVFLIFTVPLWALGLAAFLNSGLSLDRIRSQYGPAQPDGVVP